MWLNFAIVLGLIVMPLTSQASAELTQTITKVKPAIVGIGVFTPDATPQNNLYGTGFVIGNGHYIVTNYHVLPEQTSLSNKQKIVIFVGSGRHSRLRNVDVVAVSKKYDLAVLKQSGAPLPALKLATKSLVLEGESIAFTGFPIGAILGLYPVTHRGIIASITPIVIPASHSSKLSANVIKRLKNPYLVYQLDATAYPGNSGSPVYLQSSGEVVAIINKVFVQKTKESAITNPSGITYAIPVQYLYQLIDKQNINLNQ